MTENRGGEPPVDNFGSTPVVSADYAQRAVGVTLSDSDSDSDSDAEADVVTSAAITVDRLASTSRTTVDRMLVSHTSPVVCRGAVPPMGESGSGQTPRFTG